MCPASSKSGKRGASRMSHIRNPYERSRAEKRESRRLERQIRRDLVKGDGESRPEWCWSALQRLRREHNPETVEQEEKAKGRAASNKLRQMARKSDTDTMIGSAVGWSLVRGKTFIKQAFKGGMFDPKLVMPETMGVLHENYERLDENM